MNTVKVSDGKYQIQWVISNFSKQLLEIHSPIFTHTSVKIVIDLLFVESDEMILRTQFLEFPGWQVTYSIQIHNRYRTFPETMRSFVFEENRRTDTVMFKSPLRRDLNEANGWLTNDTLILRLSVNQPLFQKDSFLSSKSFGAHVSLMNGTYSFQWRISTNTLEQTDLKSPEFKCGDVSLTIFLNAATSSFDFKFKTMKEAQIDLSGKFLRTDGLHQCLGFELTGFVNCAKSKLHLDPLFSLADVIADPAYNSSGVLTLEFHLRTLWASPSVAREQREGVSLMFQLDRTSQAKHSNPALETDKELGLAGLSSTGETCCMNSLLHSMFHIPLLRRRIYEIKTEDPIHTELKRLFAQMQLTQGVCSSARFVKTLGYHDRSHVCRIGNFCAKLPDIMASEDAAQLLRGELSGQRFYELMVPVKGCECLDESISKVIGDKPITTPPVLLIHLDRFSGNRRLTDRLEFSEEIEISGERYCLYSTIVHSGVTEGGHYHAFLRLGMKDQWVKCNDSNVRTAERSRAIEDNFGGVAIIASHTYPKSYSANMLIYVRESMIDDLFADVGNDEIPEDLREYVVDLEESKQKKMDLEHRRKYVAFVSLLTEDTIRKTVMNGDSVKLGTLETQVVEMPIDTPLTSLYEKFGGDTIRLWAFSQMHRFPDKIIPNESSATLEVLVGNVTSRRVKIFVQKKQAEEPLDVGRDQILVFVKFFFKGISRPLQYVGCITTGRDGMVSDLFPKIAELIGSDSSEMIAYRDNCPPKLLNPMEVLSAQFIDQGTFIIAEFTTPAAYTFAVDQYAGEHHRAVATDTGRVIHYLDHFPDQVITSVQEYSFRPDALYEISSIDVPDVLIGVVKIPVALPIVELKKLIASVMRESITYDPAKDSMVLYRMDPLTGQPSTSVLMSMASPVTSRPDRVFYSVVAGTSEDEMNKGIQYRIEYSSDAYTVKYVRIVYASRNSTCRMLYSLFKKSVSRGDFDEGPVRYLRITGRGSVELMQEDEEFRKNSCTLRIEVVPQEHRMLRKDQVLIPVDNGNTHSLFLVLVNHGELFAEVKARMRAVMECDARFDTFTFTLKTGKTASMRLRDDTPMNHRDLSSKFAIVVNGHGPKFTRKV